MSSGFEYVFPAIRGIQAQREYYVSMCPMRLLPRLFHFDDEELVPELRAQRQLNKARLPELSRYLTENADNYVFSAITVSVDAQVKFEQLDGQGNRSQIGNLHIPMSARFIINDGQHRRAAIDLALRLKPELGDESIAVVFFLDPGLARCQQMFADLNRYAIRPSKSLSILYDYRDHTAQLTKALIAKSKVFREMVELEKTSLARRSRCLFTLSALYHATEALISDLEDGDPGEEAELALKFWETVAENLSEWTSVRNGQLKATDLRQNYIHSYSVVLQALAHVGKVLIAQYPNQWREKLAAIKTIDWRRGNSSLWEGRAMIGGNISKANRNVVLTTNAIKLHIGLELSDDEKQAEDAFNRGKNGKKQS